MHSTEQIIFTLVSLAIIIIFCVLTRNVNEKWRVNILRIISLLTILVHLSNLVYFFFVSPDTRTISNERSTIWPYHFCNVIMWMLPITFCGPKVLKKLYPFVLTGALLGGIITLAYPDFYNANRSLWYWTNFKSYLSHVLMVLAYLFAVTSGEYKPRVKTFPVFIIGLLAMGLWGLFTNWLFSITGIPAVNSMYFNAPAIDGTFLYGYVIGILFMIIIFAKTLIFEISLPKEERFLTKIGGKIFRKNKQ